MAIDSDKNDLILGGLGVLFVVGALVLIGVGARKSFNKNQESYSQSSQQKTKVSTSSTTQKKSTSSQQSPDQEESESELSSESMEEGLTVTRVSSEPAEDPNSEDIDHIVMEDSQCSPSQVEKRGRAGIILEVRAQDQDYSFRVGGINLEENFQQGQTKTITFPAFLISSDTISFHCQSLN